MPLLLAMTADQDTWSCGQCGRQIDHDFQVCWNCGSSRSGVADPSFKPDDAIRPMGFYCQRCGYDLSKLQQRVCPECAHPFDPGDMGTFSERSPEFMRAQLQGFIMAAVLFVLAFAFIMLGRLFPGLFSEIFDTTTVVRSKFVADLKEANLAEAGDILIPIQEGAVTEDKIYASLGDIVIGNKPGRENDDEITVFKSCGLAIQDISTALAVYKAAIEKNIGTEISL